MVLTSPGSGTEIIIRLKMKTAREADFPQKQEASSASSDDASHIDYTGKRILLVEDNYINREIANMILTQEGFTVESAENAQIAVDMVAQRAGTKDAGMQAHIAKPVDTDVLMKELKAVL